MAKNEVRTPLGVVRERTQIVAASTRESPTGPWDGYSWKGDVGVTDTESASTMTGASIRFSLGHRSNGDGILYYNARKLENGKLIARFVTVLFYPRNPQPVRPFKPPQGPESR